jgi:hypothetical protein
MSRNLAMNTTRKIAAARVMYHAIHAGCTLLGREDQETFVRDGVTYDLDLSQGIDFVIFLGNIYEHQTKAALSKLVSPAPLVLDIRANIGARTFILLNSSGQTIA